MASRRLGEILIERKLIAPQALEHALVEQKKSGELLGRVLVLELALGLSFFS